MQGILYMDRKIHLYEYIHIPTYIDQHTSATGMTFIQTKTVQINFYMYI
jgi:hypothetical protein